MTAYTNVGSGKKRVSFASPYPGKIIPLDLLRLGGPVICQKDAFLCAAKGVSIGISFQKKLGAGLFGGEGFIMQKLEGDGMAFCHAGGHIIKRTLQEGASLKIDTGCIVAYTKDIDFDIIHFSFQAKCLLDFYPKLNQGRLDLDFQSLHYLLKQQLLMGLN
jgi:uncharacterized protein (AIM24 family)